ncbi:uncharacterized protein PAC_05083 [Phialocephala subalpina]|uniref:Uncharacterized protein n=1 Tax=Phialocephala subalpina TaxID=576137 RepID=A0A1L7WQZ2_9HELO|nr:uncharacterized protein PAC_05083 [Phialocephala subalpina]
MLKVRAVRGGDGPNALLLWGSTDPAHTWKVQDQGTDGPRRESRTLRHARLVRKSRWRIETMRGWVTAGRTVQVVWW